MTSQRSVLLILGLVLLGGCEQPKVPAGFATGASLSNFGHIGITNGCAACHDAGKPFDGFSAAGITNSTLINEMQHNTSGLPDCATCHYSTSQAANFSTWATSESALGNASIMTLSTTGVFHTNYSPTSCASCHSGLAPLAATTDVNGNAVPAHTSSFVTGDCIGCHSGAIGLDWTKASNTGHTATQTNCAACHGSSGSASTRYQSVSNVLTSQMLHTYTGLPDCYLCHRAQALTTNFTATMPDGWVLESVSNTSITTLSTPGVFHSNFTPTTCATCHGGLAPQTATTDVNGKAVPAHTSTFLGAADCAACHNGGSGLDWTKAENTGHSPPYSQGCVICHGASGSYKNDLPSTSNWYVITGSTTVLANQSDDISIGTVADNTVYTLTINGMNATITSGTGSTGGTIFTALQTAITALGQPVSEKINSQTNNTTGVTTYTMTITGNTVGVTFTDVAGTSNLSVQNRALASRILTGGAYNPNASNRNLIHDGNNPTAATSALNAPGGFNHDPALGGSQDCVTCHTQTSNAKANVGITWVNTGFIDHTTYPNSNQSCAPCHSQAFETSHEGKTLTSVPASQSCAASGCHNLTVPPATGTAPDFGGNLSGC